MQITLVTAKDGSDIQLCLEEAVKTMNIAKLKKIQVIPTDKLACLVNFGRKNSAFTVHSANGNRGINCNSNGI
jgi:hypothetical protein